MRATINYTRILTRDGEGPWKQWRKNKEGVAANAHRVVSDMRNSVLTARQQIVRARKTGVE